MATLRSPQSWADRPVVVFDNVSVRYPGAEAPALKRVSLTITGGEFVFLVGSSGSGKSTFLGLLTRERRPSEGSVRVVGRDLGSLRRWRIPVLRRHVGVVYQEFRLLPSKTVAENVAYALYVTGKRKAEIAQIVPEVLEQVGLAGKAERLPGELSGGEQQRVAIARAIVNQPALLIADEPTGNLDPDTSVGIVQLLDRINRSGTTVMMATHDDSIVNQLRRRVIQLDEGTLVRDQERGAYHYTS